MKTITIILMLLYASSLTAKPIITVYHVSGTTCGKYISDISDSPQAIEVYSWWLAGFITAMNIEKSRVTTTDKHAHELWVKNYCKDNPLDLFVNAAVQLDKQLSKKGRK
jgi:hypothetical protein